MNNVTELENLGSSRDVVLEEIWRVKGELSAACNHDLDTLFAQARERQKSSGRKIVDFSKEKG
jgi:hypothetical protein